MIITFPRVVALVWLLLLMMDMDSPKLRIRTPGELRILVRWPEVMPLVDPTASLEVGSIKPN